MKRLLAAKRADRRLQGLRDNGDVRAGARVAGGCACSPTTPLDTARSAPTLSAAKLIRGLTLRATDLDWITGDGPLVEGPARPCSWPWPDDAAWPRSSPGRTTRP